MLRRRVWLGAFVFALSLTAGAEDREETQPQLPKAWIGIAFADVPASGVPAEYPRPGGGGCVRVENVFPGTSGEQAGLAPGDYVLAVNGEPLDGRNTLLDAVNSRQVGDVVELRIGRGGQVLDVKMALSPKPEDMRSVTKLLVGSAAPELDGRFYHGDPGTLRSLVGRAVVLDFWATWCGPCRLTLPALEQLYAKYRTRGLEIVGISSEDVQTLKAFQKSEGQSYPLLQDTGQRTQRKYMAFAYPTMVYIGRDGIIRRIESGARSAEHIESRILELLEG